MSPLMKLLIFSMTFEWTGSQTGRINALPEIIYVKECDRFDEQKFSGEMRDSKK